MRRIFRISILVLALGCVGDRVPRASAEGIAWLTDLETARREAAKSGRPLFLVFRCEP